MKRRDTSLENNPFWVWTPEDISADQATQLFVDIFSDFPAVESPSHTFVNGPRGSGKSMMFRMMRADCAGRRQGCDLHDLRYLGIYIPIKRTEVSQTELGFLDSHPARFVFTEHLLCLYFAMTIFDELASDRLQYSRAVERSFFDDWSDAVVVSKLQLPDSSPARGREQLSDTDAETKRRFRALRDLLQASWASVESLIRALPLNIESLTGYDGPLLSYHGFLLPLLEALRTLACLPDQRVYLLVDDADNLSRTQTEIFNSWIAARTTARACIKASTQLRYKTWSTPGGQRVEAPHDYNEVDVSVLYTTRREHYLDRLELIVKKRLAAAGLPANPGEFFPEDHAQLKTIQALAQELREIHAKGGGRGNRARDDANRYARPEFIRRLGGKRKSTHSYSYSGFQQLAHVSSGVIRWFLEPAARMYGEQQSGAASGRVQFIEPAIQDGQIREFSEEFFGSEFQKRKQEAKERIAGQSSSDSEGESDYRRLEYLLDAMGRTFLNILKDEKRSERRVFSIALSDRTDEEVQRVLDLGVREGYLYRSTIGRKSGYGRTTRYVLSRRLAPYFSLDPTSFSGYLFVTNDNLRRAMASSKALLREEVPDDDVQMELPVG